MYLTWIILGLAAYKFKSFEGHVKCRSPIFSGELCMETKPSSRQRLPRGAEAAGSSQHLQALRSSLGFSWKHLCLHIVVTSCHFKHKNVLTSNSWFWSASTRLDQLRSHPCGHQYAHKSPIMWSLTSSFTVHMCIPVSDKLAQGSFWGWRQYLLGHGVLVVMCVAYSAVVFTFHAAYWESKVGLQWLAYYDIMKGLQSRYLMLSLILRLGPGDFEAKDQSSWQKKRLRL